MPKGRFGSEAEMIRRLISRWHRDELGAERKAARRKCSKALAPILDIIRKHAVHASLKAVESPA
jgi:Arc/MetJ-type ribon-helix-helix transcriptional regulator